MARKSFFMCALTLVALLFNTLPAEEAYQLPPLGKEVVSEGKTSYEHGEYKRFIRALNAEVQKAGKMGLLKKAYEKMKNASVKNTPADLEKLKVRNQRLLEACAAAPNLQICQRAQNVALFTLTSEEQEALNAIKGLRYKFSEDKQLLTVEEKLSAIETRFRMLGALLEIAFEKTKPALATRIKKQEALSLEKFSKMERIAKNDPVWSTRIAHARQATEAKLANKLDWGVLRDLADGKIQAGTRAEVEIAQVVRETREVR